MPSLDDRYGEETIISPETRTHIHGMASWMRVAAVTTLVASMVATVLGITLAYAFWVSSQKKDTEDEYVWAIFGLVFAVPGVVGLISSVVRLRSAKNYINYIEAPGEDMLNKALVTMRKYMLWAVAVNVLLILIFGGALAMLLYGIIVKGLK